MRRELRRVALASVLGVVGLFGVLTPSVADGASLDSTELDLLGRVNEFRAARGLPTLAIGIGRGYASGSVYGWYWTADFGGVVDAGRTAAAFDVGYHARWSGQSPDPTLAAGQTATLVVALQNSGYRGWYAGVPNQQAALGTSAPLDGARPDLAFNWLSLSRPATATTSYVGPGQVGWFQFTVRAPSTPGDYRLALRGVVDGVTWLEDAGLFFTIHVR